MRILVAGGVLLISAYSLGYRTTWTHSLPFGLYRLVEVSPGAVQLGDLVLLCLPAEIGRWARGRGYLSKGSCPGRVEPVGKLIAAVSGDRIIVRRDGIFVRHRLPHSRPLSLDSRHRPLPHPSFGVYELSDGELWLHAPHPRSFDSRVYGSVSRESVRAGLAAVLVPGYPVARDDLLLFVLTVAGSALLPILSIRLECRDVR